MYSCKFPIMCLPALHKYYITKKRLNFLCHSLKWIIFTHAFCVCDYFPDSSNVGSSASIRFSIPSPEQSNLTQQTVIPTINNLVSSYVNTAGLLQQWKYSERVPMGGHLTCLPNRGGGGGGRSSAFNP